MVVINGESKEFDAALPLKRLLEQEGYDICRIAVEINGDIIPKAAFDETVVNNGDTMEVVSFVGGG